MAFTFKNMSPSIRQIMSAEIAQASQSNNFYLSTRFNNKGTILAANLIAQAANNYCEHWLAYEIESQALMKEYETRSKPLGGYTAAHVPHTAAETYAEGQFNRFYMIAICLEAVTQGKKVKVYRAKPVGNSRGSSNSLIGSEFDPSVLVLELRDVKTSLGHPLLKPNSGLSIEIS